MFWYHVKNLSCEYIFTIQTFLLFFGRGGGSQSDIKNHPNSLYIQACYLDVELSMPTIVKYFHLKQVMKGHFINQDENPLSLALGLVSGELLLHKQLLVVSSMAHHFLNYWATNSTLDKLTEHQTLTIIEILFIFPLFRNSSFSEFSWFRFLKTNRTLG